MMKLVRHTGWAAALVVCAGTGMAQQPTTIDWPT